MPDGRILKSGPDAVAERYDPALGVWTPVAARNVPERYEATSVLLPGLTKVMIAGGNDNSGGQPSASVEILDLGAPVPVWTTVAHMQNPRFEHDAVLLPDGTVLVVGGRTSSSTTNPQPVLIPELYDPVAGTWRNLAAHQIPRRYHSTTLLLPDGRVLAAGGDNQASGEIFSPPYLFRGTRPSIVSAPSAVTYGGTFSVEFTSSHGQNTLVLIRASSATHSINMGQRYVSLGQVGPGGIVSVTAPANGNVAPPGYYMLFAVDVGGVPSVARMVRIVSDFGTFEDLGNALAGTNGSPSLIGSGRQIGGELVQFGLQNGLPGSPAALVLGFSALNLPLFGGVLVPSPDLSVPGLTLDGNGEVSVALTYPTGLPSALELYLQYWFLDGGAAQGLAATNALRTRSP